jgi:excisionase family DNA binding protein
VVGAVTPELMTPAEVAALFRVKTVTVARWRRLGRLSYVRMPNGRDVRYFAAEVRALRDGRGSL